MLKQTIIKRTLIALAIAFALVVLFVCNARGQDKYTIDGKYVVETNDVDSLLMAPDTLGSHMVSGMDKGWTRGITAEEIKDGIETFLSRFDPDSVTVLSIGQCDKTNYISGELAGGPKDKKLGRRRSNVGVGPVRVHGYYAVAAGYELLTSNRGVKYVVLDVPPPKPTMQKATVDTLVIREIVQQELAEKANMPDTLAFVADNDSALVVVEQVLYHGSITGSDQKMAVGRNGRNGHSANGHNGHADKAESATVVDTLKADGSEWIALKPGAYRASFFIPTRESSVKVHSFYAGGGRRWQFHGETKGAPIVPLVTNNFLSRLSITLAGGWNYNRYAGSLLTGSVGLAYEKKLYLSLDYGTSLTAHGAEVEGEPTELRKVLVGGSLIFFPTDKFPVGFGLARVRYEEQAEALGRHVSKIQGFQPKVRVRMPVRKLGLPVDGEVFIEGSVSRLSRKSAFELKVENYNDRSIRIASQINFGGK